MRRVADSRNPAKDKFGPGKNGYQGGNLAAGQTATSPGYEMFDALQEEIAGVIEGVGITLDSTKFNQLYLAIRRIFSKGVTLADTGAANVYTATNNPALAVGDITPGLTQQILIKTTNTGASTYSPDGVRADPIYGLGLQPLQGGELVAGSTAIWMSATIAGVNGGSPIWVLLECMGGAQQVPAGTKSQHAAQTARTGTAGGLTMRNLLINAAGNVNQRAYVSGTATTSANQYAIDRWKVVTSGQALSWATSGVYSIFTAPAGGVSQVVEGLNILGGTYVLSWTGTATATVNGAAVANGGTVVLPANTNATVTFSGGTFSLPQLELGTVPTAFDFRGYGIELMLCQRYFERLALTGTVPAYGIGSVGSGVAYITVPFQTKKRSNPSVSFSALNTFYAWSFSAGNINPTAMTATSSTTSVGVNATISSGSSGQVAVLEDTGSGTSWIAIDADI